MLKKSTDPKAMRKSDASSDNDFELDRGDIFIHSKQPQISAGKGLQLQGKTTTTKVTNINFAGAKPSFLSDLEQVIEGNEGKPSKSKADESKMQAFFDMKSDISSSESFALDKLTPDLLKKHNHDFNIGSESDVLDSEEGLSSGSEDDKSSLLEMLTQKRDDARPIAIGQPKAPAGVNFSLKATGPEAPKPGLKQPSSVPEFKLELKSKDDPFKVETDFPVRDVKPAEAPRQPISYRASDKAYKPEVEAPRRGFQEVEPQKPPQSFRPNDKAFKTENEVPVREFKASEAQGKVGFNLDLRSPPSHPGAKAFQISKPIDAQAESFYVKPEVESAPQGDKLVLPRFHSKQDSASSNSQQGGGAIIHPSKKSEPITWAVNFDMPSETESEQFHNEKVARPDDKKRLPEPEIKPLVLENLGKFKVQGIKNEGKAFSVSSSEESESFSIKVPKARAREAEAPKSQVNEISVESKIEKKPTTIPPLALEIQAKKFQLSGAQATSEQKLPSEQLPSGKVNEGDQGKVSFKLSKPIPGTDSHIDSPVQDPSANVQLRFVASSQLSQPAPKQDPQPGPSVAVVGQFQGNSGALSKAPDNSSFALREHPSSAGVPGPSVPILQPSLQLNLNASQPSTTSLAYSDIMEAIGLVDLTRETEEVKASEKKPGCWDCFTGFFGCTADELCEEMRENRRKILALSLIRLDPENALHKRMIQSFWRTTSRSQELVSVVGDHWRQIGFTENNPCVELKESGFLTMILLLNISSRFPKLTQEIIFFSRSPATNFPWATLGARIVQEMLTHLRIGDFNMTFNLYRKTNSLFSTLFCAAYLHCFRLYARAPQAGIEECFNETVKVLSKTSDQLIDEIRGQIAEEAR